MNRTILIVIGILAAVIAAAGIMQHKRPIHSKFRGHPFQIPVQVQETAKFHELENTSFGRIEQKYIDLVQKALSSTIGAKSLAEIREYGASREYHYLDGSVVKGAEYNLNKDSIELYQITPQKTLPQGGTFLICYFSSDAGWLKGYDTQLTLILFGSGDNFTHAFPLMSNSSIDSFRVFSNSRKLFIFITAEHWRCGSDLSICEWNAANNNLKEVWEIGGEWVTWDKIRYRFISPPTAMVISGFSYDGELTPWCQKRAQQLSEILDIPVIMEGDLCPRPEKSSDD